MFNRLAIFLNIFGSVLTQFVDTEPTNIENQIHNTTHTHTHVHNKKAKEKVGRDCESYLGTDLGSRFYTLL